MFFLSSTSRQLCRPVPRIRGQGREGPPSPGLVTAGVMDVVLPRRGKRAAYGSAPFIDAARDMDPDLSHEGHTAGGMALGALHSHETVVDLDGQIGGHAAQGDLVGLPPVKRRPVKRTTGPALQARIVAYYCTSGIGLRKGAAMNRARGERPELIRYVFPESKTILFGRAEWRCSLPRRYLQEDPALQPFYQPALPMHSCVIS